MTYEFCKITPENGAWHKRCHLILAVKFQCKFWCDAEQSFFCNAREMAVPCHAFALFAYCLKLTQESNTSTQTIPLSYITKYPKYLPNSMLLNTVPWPWGPCRTYSNLYNFLFKHTHYISKIMQCYSPKRSMKYRYKWGLNTFIVIRCLLVSVKQLNQINSNRPASWQQPLIKVSRYKLFKFAK